MKLSIIIENLNTKMPILLKTVNDINKSIATKTNGAYTQSIPFRIISKENNITDDNHLIQYLNQYDPTKEIAKYTQWIIRITGEGRIKLPEDGERLYKALSIFDKVKQSTKIPINKDINSYKHFREFEKLMQQYNEAAADNNLSVRQWEKWIKTKGYRKIYSDSKFTLLRFDMLGKKIEVYPDSVNEYESNWIPTHFGTPDKTKQARNLDIAAVAVSKLACGTSYCVANPVTAEGYLSGGPLYAIFKEGKFMLLADALWSEFKNKDDIQLSTPSPQLALFLSKVIISNQNDITGINRLASLISKSAARISNQKAIDIMQKAISIAMPQRQPSS